MTQLLHAACRHLARRERVKAGSESTAFHSAHGLFTLQFHLENSKARASQRIREDRAKPIDLLARDILLWDAFPVGEEPPYKIFDAMPLSEVKDIREEILEYQVCRQIFVHC